MSSYRGCHWHQGPRRRLPSSLWFQHISCSDFHQCRICFLEVLDLDKVTLPSLKALSKKAPREPVLAFNEGPTPYTTICLYLFVYGIFDCLPNPFVGSAFCRDACACIGLRGLHLRVLSIVGLVLGAHSAPSLKFTSRLTACFEWLGRAMLQHLHRTGQNSSSSRIVLRASSTVRPS